jgi:choline dehydrogenase-like flavoprotein
MGPVNGWFPEAARQGAKFVEGMQVERVLFEQKEGKKVARGVIGVWTSREGEKVDVVVRAKKVVVSCGTLWSPVVLMNSGLKVRTEWRR